MENGRFNFADVYSLYMLSLRNSWWRADRRDIRTLRGFSYRILQLLMWGLPVIFIIVTVYIIMGIWLARSAATLGGVLGVVVLYLIVFAIWAYIAVRPSRFRFNVRYRQSAWWQNTGIRPNELRRSGDRGMWGEYIATMAAELNMKRNHLYGRVFNNVVVPKRNGDFTEIDVLYVNETGIHIIEAKSRAGIFVGSYVGKVWVQNIGNTSNDLESPLYQNFQHSNFLVEYLYENLADGALKEKGLSNKMVNVVLFCSPDGACQLNGDYRGMAAFCGGAEWGSKSYRASNIRKFYGINIERAEVDTVCQIVDGISHIPSADRAVMMEKRNEAYERGQYRSFYQYFVASAVFPPEWNEDFYLCRTDGFYTMYLNVDGWYASYPEAKILSVGKKFTDEQLAMEMWDWVNQNQNNSRVGSMFQPYQDQENMNESKWHESVYDAIEKCPHCGGVVKPDQKFCVNCGKDLSEPVQAQQNPAVCPTCGAALKVGVHFCGKCGTKIS